MHISVCVLWLFQESRDVLRRLRHSHGGFGTVLDDSGTQISPSVSFSHRRKS